MKVESAIPKPDYPEMSDEEKDGLIGSYRDVPYEGVLEFLELTYDDDYPGSSRQRKGSLLRTIALLMDIEATHPEVEETFLTSFVDFAIHPTPPLTQPQYDPIVLLTSPNLHVRNGVIRLLVRQYEIEARESQKMANGYQAVQRVQVLRDMLIEWLPRLFKEAGLRVFIAEEQAAQETTQLLNQMVNFGRDFKHLSGQFEKILNPPQRPTEPQPLKVDKIIKNNVSEILTKLGFSERTGQAAEFGVKLGDAIVSTVNDPSGKKSKKSPSWDLIFLMRWLQFRTQIGQPRY